MSQRERRRRRPRHNNHVSPLTKKRRVEHGLSEREVSRAKQLRDADWSYEDIAHELHRTVREVELAIAASRSPNPKNPNTTIYTDRVTLARLREQELPGETRHQTLVRLLEEHAHFQRLLLS
jgi:hypothetical protein